MSPRSLGLSLDPNQPLPLYQQLFDRIAERIHSGAFPEGFRLPPSRKLADELGTHRNTVVRAYTALERGGFLSSTVGRGTFVRAQPKPVAKVVDAPAHTTIPWSTVVSARARSEVFSRSARITRAAARGELINLGRMQPDPELVPDELFRRCLEHVMRTMGSRALGYAPQEGVLSLRERIARDLSRQGVPARTEDVVITSGSQQALDVIARALLDPGDVALTQDPTYSGALQIFAATGALVVGIPSDSEGPDPARLRNVSRAKLIYLQANHCNPTGGCIAEGRRRQLVDWSQKTGTPIVEDDYASDLELEEGASPPPAIRALCGDAIYVSTFSKKLIPALRIGFVLCPPALSPHLVAMKHATDLGTSALLQYALAEFLDRGYLAAHINRIQLEYRERRDALVGALRRSLPSSIRFEVPARGTTLWLTLPDDVDSEAVFEEARRRGVLVAPGVLHRVERTVATRAALRLVFCYEPVPRLVEGARRLGAAIESLRSRRVRAPQRESMGVV